MQSFFKNEEYLSFCVAEGTPSLEEQKARFIEREYFADVSNIGKDLLVLIVSELDYIERSLLMEIACDKEDIEMFGILTNWQGDTKYIAENDGELFNLSIDFYNDLFTKGMFDTYLFIENTHRERMENAAHILGAMLRKRASQE
uniref:Uncharacterized protein n=1 Tax=Marseillevirus sp. TaxID=2809551 RepID=A0AA96ELM3_9VIRU|nr:hypothetical protein MarFTMF_174 [Marseillevirus sp.]